MGECIVGKEKRRWMEGWLEARMDVREMSGREGKMSG